MMKLRRVVDRMRKRIVRVLVGGVVVAMLISLVPALSSPVGGWALPDPRVVDGHYNTELPGSHVNQAIYSVMALDAILGPEHPDRWIYDQARDHWGYLVRGNIWADDYPQDWAEEDPEQRVLTWGELFDAAGAGIPPDDWADFFEVAFGHSLPELLSWILNVFFAAPDELELADPALIHINQETITNALARDEWTDGQPPGISADAWNHLRPEFETRVQDADLSDLELKIYMGVKHPDFSLYHLYEPDDWLDELLFESADESLRESHEWDSLGNNAVSRAKFWYEKALDAYEREGTGYFWDDYSEPRLRVNVYDYLGRALHYVQDLTQPAHSKGFYRHLQFQVYEAMWSGAQSPLDYFIVSSPENATGAWFAEQAHSRVEYWVDTWITDGGGIFVEPIAELIEDLSPGFWSWTNVQLRALWILDRDLHDEFRLLLESTWLSDALGSDRHADEYLMGKTSEILFQSVGVGAGMIYRFHKQIGEIDPEEPDFSLTVTIDGEGLTLPGAGEHAFEADQEVTATATPDDGWRFAGWVDGDTGDVVSTDPTVTLIMDDNKAITAVFEEIPLEFDLGDTVVTTAPLNVRDEPGLGTTVTRTQPGGTAGTILSAPDPYPRRLDSYTWWLVEYDDGTVGWSSDHRLEEYTRPTPRFSVGDTVVTTDELYVRSEPRLTDEYGIYFTDNVIKTQPAGTTGVILDFEEPWPRLVMGYDLWKVEYEDGTVGWSSDHRLMEAGTFVPVDLVLVLDRSGSMRGARMQGAKDAAISVVNMLMPQDRVAVVSFHTTASTDVELTNDFEYAKAEIQKLSVTGWTSFGAGMQLAVHELTERGSADHARVVIFLSDGHHNRDPDPDPWVDECADQGIPIYTVGLGAHPGEVGEAMLKWMSEETGGEYFFVDDLYDLENVFLRFTLEATGWPLVGTFIGTIAEGEVVEAGTFDVEPGTEYARITLNWPGSDLDLIIERPDGTEVDLGVGPDNIYSGADAKPEWAILLDPPAGTWTIKVYGKVVNPEIPFAVWVSSYVPPSHDLTISSTIGGNVTTPGEEVVTYPIGTVVNLVAVAEEDYRFVEWTGDVDEIDDVYAAETIITMHGDYFITANFEEITESVDTATGTGKAHFTPSDGVIEDLEALPELPPGVPDGVTFPHGMFSFRVTGLDAGQTVTIKVELPDAVPEDFVWWKYDEGEWYDLPIDIVAPNIITITLTDGEYPGDLDGVADGTIIDPGGPGNPRSLPSAPPGAGAAYPAWSVLLAAVMAGASLWLLRRRHAQI